MAARYEKMSPNNNGAGGRKPNPKKCDETAEVGLRHTAHEKSGTVKGEKALLGAATYFGDCGLLERWVMQETAWLDADLLGQSAGPIVLAW